MSEIHSNPFRGLDPYGPGDALFGRDSDLMLMKDRIFRNKTTLLFAGSGVGKTSFFRAKFMPEIERRYRGQLKIGYHGEWAGKDPLLALKATLQADPSETLLSFFERGGQLEGSSWIVILDQFEELFQYHIYWPYFKNFRDEICEVINATETHARFVFSMREEFIGQLSTFDNRVPDLFANYYRLKNPDRAQAEEIIRLTSDKGGAEADDAGLAALIEDLSRVEVGVGRGRKVEGIQRDYVIPPHLQLVCRGLWELEAKQYSTTDKFTYLADYARQERAGNRNPARRMLKEFCVSRMEALSPEQQGLAARAFDYLVTSQGAKMAYELKSLARHMAADEKLLAAALEQLSRKTRILRESQWQNERWFELYHDMYAPVMYEWKEGLAKKQQRDHELEQRASVYDRRAVQAEARESRDEALMLWLKALKIKDGEERRRQVGRLAGDAVALKRTFHHDGPIAASCFSADGSRIVTVSMVAAPVTSQDDEPRGSKERSLVQVWASESGEPIGKPIEVDGAVRVVALSPDNSVVVTAGEDRLRLLDVIRCRVIRKRRIPLARSSSSWPRAVRFGEGGKTILVEIQGRPQPMWLSVPLGRSGQIRKSRRYVRLAFDAGGTVVAGQAGKTIEILNARTTKPIGPPIALVDRPTAMALSRDGKKLLTAFRSGEVRMWSTETSEPLGAVMLNGGMVQRVAFGAGDTVWTLKWVEKTAERTGPQVLQWDATTGRHINEPWMAASNIRSAPRFSPGAKYLYRDARWGVNTAWETKSGKALDPVWAGEPRVSTVWCEDDSYLLSASSAGTARLWKCAQFRPLGSDFQFPSGVVSAVLSPDGSRAATVTQAGRVSVLETRGELLKEFPEDKPVELVVFGPDGKLVATLAANGTVKVRDVENGSTLAEATTKYTDSLFFSSKGRALVLTGDKARWWGFADGDRSPKPLRGGNTAHVSDNGRTFITYSWADELVHVWDGSDGRKVGAFRHQGGVRSAVLSPDGRVALSAGEDGRAVLWRIPGMRLLYELQHQGPVITAAFSKSGRYVATLSEDPFVRVWEVSQGSEVGRFRYEGAALSVAFSPDETAFVLASRWFVHLYRLEGGLAPKGSRRLGGIWTGEFRLLDPSANRLLVLVRASSETWRTKVIRFDTVDADPVSGEANVLQKIWHQRTGLWYEGEDVVPTSLVRASRPNIRKEQAKAANALRPSLDVA